jgi:hypothetical protein
MKVHRSPGKTIGLAVLSLLMTALLASLSFTGYQKEGMNGVSVVLGLIGVLFFIAFITLIWKAFDRRPVMDFSDEGLLVGEVAPQRIGWSELVAVRAFHLHKQPFIELRITPAAAARLTISRMTRLNNKALGKSNEYLTFSISGLDHQVDQILAQLEQRAQAEHQR